MKIIIHLPITKKTLYHKAACCLIHFLFKIFKCLHNRLCPYVCLFLCLSLSVSLSVSVLLCLSLCLSLSVSLSLYRDRERQRESRHHRSRVQKPMGARYTFYRDNWIHKVERSLMCVEGL